MKLTIRQLKKVIVEAFPSWEELTNKEQIATIYSDVYKEKWGVRPRHVRWDEMTDDEAQALLDALYDESGPDDFDEPTLDPGIDAPVPESEYDVEDDFGHGDEPMQEPIRPPSRLKHRHHNK